MATKGARASLEPICSRLYAQGWTLTALSERFDISINALSTWKRSTLRPGQELDDWDLARQAHLARGENLRTLVEQQETYTLGLPITERTAAVYDILSKAQANLRHWEEGQRAAAAALLAQTPAAVAEIDKPAMFLEIMEWVAARLKETDPKGLKVLAANFERLASQYKTEHAQEN